LSPGCFQKSMVLPTAFPMHFHKWGVLQYSNSWMVCVMENSEHQVDDLGVILHRLEPSISLKRWFSCFF
jgi:hypothetical protein